MLRVAGDAQSSVEDSSSFFSVDKRRKQITLFDPALCGGPSAPEDRRVGVAAPKMFAFDSIFTHEDSQVIIDMFGATGFVFKINLNQEYVLL